MVSLLLLGCGKGEDSPVRQTVGGGAGPTAPDGSCDSTAFQKFFFKNLEAPAGDYRKASFLVSSQPIYLTDAKGDRVPVTFALDLKEGGTFQMKIVAWSGGRFVRFMKYVGGKWNCHSATELRLKDSGRLTLDGGLILDNPDVKFSLDEKEYPARDYPVSMVYREGMTFLSSVMPPQP